jgi:hypothetical protein
MREVSFEAAFELYMRGTRRVERWIIAGAAALGLQGFVLFAAFGNPANRMAGVASFLFSGVALLAALVIRIRARRLASILRHAAPVPVQAVLSTREELEGDVDVYASVVLPGGEAQAWSSAPVIVAVPEWNYEPLLGVPLSGNAYFDEASGDWVAIATDHGLLIR